MSLLDRELVPLDQSRASSSATDRPRVAASRAAPAPTTPPPTTTTSNVVAAIAWSAAARSLGPSRPAPSSSVATAAPPQAVALRTPESDAPARARGEEVGDLTPRGRGPGPGRRRASP